MGAFHTCYVRLQAVVVAAAAAETADPSVPSSLVESLVNLYRKQSIASDVRSGGQRYKIGERKVTRQPIIEQCL